MIVAIRPDFPFVLCNDRLGDGKAKPEAAGPGSCEVGAVKPLKEILKLLRGYGLPFIGYGQQTMAFAVSLQSYQGGPARPGILLGIVQQDIQNLA